MRDTIEEIVTKIDNFGDEKTLTIYNYRSRTGTGYLTLDKTEATLLFLELYKFLEQDKQEKNE